MAINNPNISIIIPVYNKEKYIGTLLSMLERQSFQDYECIIIDDGSADHSKSICEEFACGNPKFILRTIENGGVSNARNVGLSMAKGQYITFIDADDEIEESYLQNLYQIAKEYDVDMVIGSFRRICDGSNWSECVNYGISGKYELTDILPQFCQLQREFGLFGWCWGKLIRSDIAKKYCFNTELKLAEDFDYYLQLYPQIKSVYIDDKPLYCYRINAENGSMISAKDDDIDYFSQLELNLRYKQFLDSMNALTGDNLRIVDENLSNYSFFTLYHCKLSEFEEYFQKVHDRWIQYQFPLKGFNLSSKCILTSIQWNAMNLGKCYMLTYRMLRRVLMGH